MCFSAVNELLLHAGVDCSISLEKPHWEEVGYTIFSGVCVCSCVLYFAFLQLSYNPGYHACNTVLVPNSRYKVVFLIIWLSTSLIPRFDLSLRNKPR